MSGSAACEQPVDEAAGEPRRGKHLPHHGAQAAGQRGRRRKARDQGNDGNGDAPTDHVVERALEAGNFADDHQQQRRHQCLHGGEPDREAEDVERGIDHGLVGGAPGHGLHDLLLAEHDDHGCRGQRRRQHRERDQQDAAERAHRQPSISGVCVAAAARSRAVVFRLSDRSCPQAAMMSRPRGVRTGLA